MVNGIKLPSIFKRKQRQAERFDNEESDESPQSPALPEQRDKAGSQAPEMTVSIDIPQKKHRRRERTVSGCSGHSCLSESTPRTRRIPNSAGSNFSGESIMHHLDKLSERDQVWFQAYRFGGR